MNILVLSDLEGTIGVVNGISNEEAAQLRIKEIEALLEVLLKEGYKHIYLCDCHGSGKNLDGHFKSVENLYIIQNYWNIDFSLKYEFALLIGFHAKAGENGLAHSFLIDFKSVVMDEKEVGEIEVFSNLLYAHGIKVIFISADEPAKDEVRNIKCKYFNSSNSFILNKNYLDFKYEIEKAVCTDSYKIGRYNPAPIEIEFYDVRIEKLVKEFVCQEEQRKVRFENCIHFLEQLPEISIRVMLWKDDEINNMLRELKKKREEITVLKRKDNYIENILNQEVGAVSYYQLRYLFERVAEIHL